MQQNLARVWRSKNFDEIVGQELSVRLLKNSLAKNRLFPVYLFSGLRGSGKTSTGRIFAAAINCSTLPQFQKDQHQALPCLTCESCMSMRAGNHPDFIEIDAASHTGVDNIRHIIESASFLPVMGAKKVYLIDEAHMLSKAAFNAFLKILEEPPATVVFLLATTEAHKILDTVISRSFQLFFDPIPQPQMVAHLKRICQAERIEFQEKALGLIAQQSEGSVRDALTIMERIALAEGDVTYEGTHRALGLIHDAVVITLFEIIAQGVLADVFEYMHQEQFERHPTVRVWGKMVALLRALLWAHNSESQNSDAYSFDLSSLKHLYSSAVILDFFELFYRAEAHFLKTGSQQVVLEALICKMVQKFNTDVEVSPVAVAPLKKPLEQPSIKESAKVVSKVNPSASPLQRGLQTQASSQQLVQERPQDKVISTSTTTKAPEVHDGWQKFLQELEKKNNPMATSVFKQGNFVKIEQGSLHIHFAKKFEFYHDWMLTNETLWRPSLETVFGEGVIFVPEFVVAPVAQVETVLSGPDVSAKAAPEVRKLAHDDAVIRRTQVQEKIDISDTQKWRTAHMVAEMFPGTITTRKE